MANQTAGCFTAQQGTSFRPGYMGWKYLFRTNITFSLIIHVKRGVYLVTHQTKGGGAFHAHGITH